MGKYVMNKGVLGSLFGIIGLIQQTRKGPRDWRLILMWVGWGLSLAVAIGTVAIEKHEAKSGK